MARLPQLLPEVRGRKVRNRQDASEWLTHLAYADDFLIVSKAVAKCRLWLREEKLASWSNADCEPVRVGASRMRPQASLVLLGVLLTRDRLGSAQYRIAAGWARFWAAQARLLTKAVSPALRLARLCAKILPVLSWGCTSWHIRQVDLVDAAVTRMASFFLHFFPHTLTLAGVVCPNMACHPPRHHG